MEGGKELVGGHLVAARVGDRLHLLREVDLQAARQLEVVLGLHQIGDAALARLRVDADDRLVVAADVHRVDRQVRHVPELGVRALLRVHALLDRVLVRAGEGRVDELAGVRMPRMHGQLVALLDDRARLVEPGQVEPGVDALGEQVQRERDHVDVAGALAVPEERPLDALGAGHQDGIRLIEQAHTNRDDPEATSGTEPQHDSAGTVAQSAAAAPTTNNAAATTNSAQPSPAGPCMEPSGPAANPSIIRPPQTTATAVHSTDDSRTESTHADTMAVTAIDAANAAPTM